MAAERTSIGPYKILRKLGEGGMGAVYEAVHEAIERRVAIKFLHAEYAHDADVTKRFFNEARAVNRIEHPSLVQISDYGQLVDGTTYIVMEYLSGETLSKRLRRLGGKLPLSESLQIAWQIAAALTVVHEKGIVHRDLKPENIMFVADSLIPSGERVKLLDFGIAKLMADVRGTQRGTRSDIIMGTPMYMSPEQCRGAGIVDAKTDVYALGVMLYEMIAGTPPFVGEGSGELIGMHLFREPRPLQELAPNLPAPMVALVHRLLIKERDGRPTMRELAAELAQKIKQSTAEPVQAVAESAELPKELAPTILYPQRPAGMESPAPQLPAGPDPLAPQLPARPDSPAGELSALRERHAEPNRSTRASRRWPLLALAALGVITVAGAQLLRSSRHPAPVQTARVIPPAPVTPPAPKPALPQEANPAASAKSPIAEFKAENPPPIIPGVSSAQPAANPEPGIKSTGENANSLVPAVEKPKMKGSRKFGLAEKAKAPAAPTAATIPIDNSTGNAKPASPAADVTAPADSKKPDEGQKADSSETVARSGKLVEAQRLYLQKNYVDAMKLAMQSENSNSVDSLVLIGQAACALHTTDIAARKLNQLKGRPADRALILDKCAEEGFKYSEGQFSPN